MIGSARIPVAWFGSYITQMEPGTEFGLVVSATVTAVSPGHVELALDAPRMTIDDLGKLAALAKPRLDTPENA